MQIFIDADACPVVGIVETIAEKYNISTPCCVIRIIFCILITARDVVVSQDYGDATMALVKRAHKVR